MKVKTLEKKTLSFLHLKEKHQTIIHSLNMSSIVWPPPPPGVPFIPNKAKGGWDNFLDFTAGIAMHSPLSHAKTQIRLGQKNESSEQHMGRHFYVKKTIVLKVGGVRCKTLSFIKVISQGVKLILTPWLFWIGK